MQFLRSEIPLSNEKGFHDHCVYLSDETTKKEEAASTFYRISNQVLTHEVGGVWEVGTGSFKRQLEITQISHILNGIPREMRTKILAERLGRLREATTQDIILC